MNIQDTISQHVAKLPENVQAEILSFVLFLEQKHQPGPANSKLDEDQRRQKIADCLTALAQSNPFSDIQDPVAWQREMRQDRPLPGRE